MLLRILGTLIATAWLAGPTAQAAQWDESVQGDLSGNRFAPTVLVLDPGANTVSANFGPSPVAGVYDLDYLTTVVPTGYRLDEIVLTRLVQGGSNSFIGAMQGPVFDFAPTDFDPSPLLGWMHLFTYQQGSNLLPAMNIAGPLAAGAYSFWINELDTFDVFSYGLEFRVTPVPEPAAVVALLAGLGALALRARTARRRVGAA